jgi:hypothetical protein
MNDTDKTRGVAAARDLEYYGRYLQKRHSRRAVQQMDQGSIERELLLTRALLDELLDLFQEAENGEEKAKLYLPVIARYLKLISDFVKQLGAEDKEDNWGQILDGLSEELGVDL